MKNRYLVAIVAVLLTLIAFQYLFVPRQELTPLNPSPTPTDERVAMLKLGTRTPRPTYTPTEQPPPTDTSTPLPTAAPTHTPAPTSTFTPTPVPIVAAKITEDLVNLRAGPGTDYPLIERLTAGAEIEVLGRNQDADWMIVQAEDGSEGWLFRDLLSDLDEGQNLAVMTPESAPPAKIAVELANVRSGPGEAFTRVARYAEGKTVDLVGRTPESDWVAVKIDDVEGWIYAELLRNLEAMPNLPVLTPPPTPTPRPPTATPKPVTLASAAAGAPRVDRKVIANYFAWYDGNGWGDCNISAGDKPVQQYHSDDPGAIGRHVDMAINAGLDGFTLQWVGPNDRTDRNFASLLSQSQGKNFASTVVFLRHIWPGANQGNTIEAIRYLQNQYSGHPNFLRVQGRPVIFFTDVYRVPRPAGQNAKNAWANIRNQVDPGRNFWWIAEGLDPSFLSVFDGLWVYKVSHAAYPNDYVKASTWANRVRAMENKTGQAKLWVGTLMPGWDDRRAGCRADIRVPSAPFVRPREDGNFYRATYNAAVKSNPDILWIHSFNEWVEGSYIEPSQFYGDTYINITREIANQFKNG